MKGDFQDSIPAAVGPGETLRLDLRLESREQSDSQRGNLEIRIRRGDSIYRGTAMLTGPDGERKLQPEADGIIRLSELLPGRHTLRLVPEEEQETNRTEPIRLDPPALFGFDSHTLDGKARRDLARIIQALPAHDEAGALLRLECRGFTDRTGTNQYNRTLSLKRAIACKEALTEELRKSGTASRLRGKVEITTSPRGELSGTGAGQRRVEFWLEKRRLLPDRNDSPNSPSSGRQGPRILLVGDSWAQNMWKMGNKSPIRDALADEGLSEDEADGELTALGSTLASNWVKDAPLNWSPSGPITANTYQELLKHIEDEKAAAHGEETDPHRIVQRLTAAHQDNVSLLMLRIALAKHPNIKIIHMSLGGNDILLDLMKETVEPLAKEWVDLLYRDPLGQIPADRLRHLGWRRPDSDFSSADRNRMNRIPGEFAAALPGHIRRYVNHIRRIIQFIHSIRPEIRICLAGYTAMFVNAKRPATDDETLRLIREMETASNPADRARAERDLRTHGHPVGPYYFGASSGGFQNHYFNAVVIPELERQLRDLAAEDSNRLHYLCMYPFPQECFLDADDLRNYFYVEKPFEDFHFPFVERNNYAWLQDRTVADGFHLTYEGYKAMADRFVGELYRRLLDADSRTRAT